MKYEDRSQEDTARQQRCAQSKAWDLAKNIFRSSKRTTRLLARGRMGPPVAEPKEPEEFVADSGASVHVVSKRDLDSAELETMRISSGPMTVMTANGEVQTRQEAL